MSQRAASPRLSHLGNQIVARMAHEAVTGGRLVRLQLLASQFGSRPDERQLARNLTAGPVASSVLNTRCFPNRGAVRPSGRYLACSCRFGRADGGSDKATNARADHRTDWTTNESAA